jgi:hypothetical protein
VLRIVILDDFGDLSQREKSSEIKPPLTSLPIIRRISFQKMFCMKSLGQITNFSISMPLLCDFDTHLKVVTFRVKRKSWRIL